MGRRHLTTAVTMLVLVAILVAGVLVGVNVLFRPVPSSDKPTAEPTASCTTKKVRKGQKLRSRQVQVSVFNAGGRSGLADTTLTRLTTRGFQAGKAGNAPSTAKVRRVQVWTRHQPDPAARLVARQFGTDTKIRVVKVDLGPGVDVVVGNALDTLARKAPRAVAVKRAAEVCVPLPTDTATLG